MTKKYKITIYGGGNIGTQFAVHFSELKNDVTIFTPNKSKFSNELSIVNENNTIIHSTKNFRVTNEAKKAFTDAEIIIITLPAFLMKEAAITIYPFIHHDLKILFIPGTGGVEWAFNKCIEKGVEVFGLQRVPSVARLVQYGKCVKATGYRKQLLCGSISKESSLLEICKLLETTFCIPCNPLPNYLSVSLTPSNPILHTARLYNLFNDYSKTKIYEKQSLFYEDWNDDTSELLINMDSELQNICSNLIEFDLSNVISLKKHYESNSKEELTKKIKSIESFKGLLTPMIRNENGFIPDFSSRYFLADFPYGLSILLQISELIKINSPNMHKVFSWYKNIQPQVKYFSFFDYGIIDRLQFIDFYNSHKIQL